MLRQVCLLLLLSLSLLNGVVCKSVAFAKTDSIEFFVSKAGKADGTGSIDNPFNNLEMARDAIRNLKKNGEYPKDGVIVYLREGRYFIDKSFVLEEDDGGTPEGPVTYSAFGAEEVSIIGGAEIQLSDCSISNDERIPENAKGHVYSYNLRANNINDYGELHVTGHSQYYLYINGWATTDGGTPLPQVYFDETPMTLARYPNDDFMYISKVIEAGSFGNKNEDPNAEMIGMEVSVMDSQISKWVNAAEPWVFGYWKYDWSDMTTPVESFNVAERSIKTKYASHFPPLIQRPIYVYNMIEELDAPGEWFYDKSNGQLYLYPLESKKEASILMAFSTDSLISIKDAENIIVRNIQFKGTRGNGISINNSDKIGIKYCTISNVSNIGISANGTNLEINGCRVNSIGTRGIVITGGDTVNLVSSNNIVQNCIVHDFARLTKMMQAGIRIGGVGVTVRNNLVYDGPQLGINFGGNDHLIENNEIHSVMKESTDGGAIYAGQSFAIRGTVIRGNVIHNIRPGVGGIYGVYLDDRLSGTTVTENVFYNIGSAAMFNQGGRDNVFTNNIIAKVPIAVSFYGFAGSAEPRTYLNHIREEQLSNQAYWKYPNYKDLPNDEPLEPKYGIVKNNICYDVTTPLRISVGYRPITVEWIEENNELETPIVAYEDIGFTSMHDGNFTLKENNNVSSLVSGFIRTPPEKIGLMQVQLKKILERNNAVSMSINKPTAYNKWSRTLIDKDNYKITPFIKDELTYVPLRFFAESLGANVEFREGYAVIEYEERTMKVASNHSAIFLNDQQVNTEAIPLLFEGRIFVPLRICSELFDKHVFWDDSGLIIISDADISGLISKEMAENMEDRI